MIRSVESNEEENDVTEDDDELAHLAHAPGAAAQPGGVAGEPPPSPPPPHGPRVRIILLVVVVALLALLAGVRWSGRFRGLWAKIHPGQGPETEASVAGEVHYYTCGMHPWVILPKPGACPICHMKLVPLDPSKFTGEIAISPVVTQNIGVRIAPTPTASRPPDRT